MTAWANAVMREAIAGPRLRIVYSERWRWGQLPGHAICALKRAGYRSVHELRDVPRSKRWAIKNAGAKTQRAIARELGEADEP